MTRLETCSHCTGFLPPDSQSCPHCGARACDPGRSRFGALRQRLGRALLGAACAAVTVTLMACYGAPYDCYDDECYRACYDNTDCFSGEVCTDWGTCEWSGVCERDADCLGGDVCNLERQTCEPRPPDESCRSHADCDIFERCDSESGACVDARPCDADAACGDGETCELTYEICVPCGPDGCDAEPACGDLATEASCLERDGCQSLYRGIDCRAPDGGDCSEGAADCQCDRFVFDQCVAVEPGSQPGDTLAIR